MLWYKNYVRKKGIQEESPYKRKLVNSSGHLLLGKFSGRLSLYRQPKINSLINNINIYLFFT